ncbi:MAG: protein translocase subunit SecD [Alphaproteobacteria bacterium]
MKDKRIWAILAVVVISIIYLVPTVTGIDFEWWPAEKVNLGLDLQGGMHVVLTVDVDKAIRDELGHYAKLLKNVFKDRELAYEQVSYDAEKNQLQAVFADDAARKKAREYLQEYWSDYELANIGEFGISLTMREEVVRSIRQNALSQATETISNRVDEFNVREPEIYTQGEDQIVVRLPGVVDPTQAKNLIGKTAALDFKLVTEKAGFAYTEEQLLAPHGGSAPTGYQVYPLRGETREEIQGYYLLREAADMSGGYLIDARTGYDNTQMPAVNFTLNDEGTRLFADISGNNIGKQMAIVLDNKVISAPVIRSRIVGNGQITGLADREEAHNLAIVLRAGALPVPIRIDEERTVGATLGEDSIAEGTMSFIIGGVLVLIFMVIYYRKVGIAGVTALVLNVIMLMAGLALFGATLTLPGIAGIILTIGMAVDANVIINERIREELRNGKTPISAVNTGYARATWTILDAQITTLVAAFVLYNFGTGAIKGFAVTLTIGLVASLFTAIIVTRVIVEKLAQRSDETLSI